MENPPAGYRPEGWVASPSQQQQRVARPYTFEEAIRVWQWYGLWTLLFLNTTAGIAIISQAAPMSQEITHISAAGAAGLVGIISIANGIGRFLWAWLSDFVGRRRGFLMMFPIQSVLVGLLPRADSLPAFTRLPVR